MYKGLAKILEKKTLNAMEPKLRACILPEVIDRINNAPKIDKDRLKCQTNLVAETYSHKLLWQQQKPLQQELQRAQP